MELYSNTVSISQYKYDSPLQIRTSYIAGQHLHTPHTSHTGLYTLHHCWHIHQISWFRKIEVNSKTRVFENKIQNCECFTIYIFYSVKTLNFPQLLPREYPPVSSQSGDTGPRVITITTGLREERRRGEEEPL